MAFRLLNNFPVYLNNEGQPASGGYLRFYDAGTTAEKAVYSDRALTQSAGSRVSIDSDGRTATDVWGDGSYYVRLYGADDVMIAEADHVEVAGGTGASIPEMVDGYFLTNSGGLLLWAPVLQVLDPTGQSGKTLGSDGTNLTWVAAPVAPTLPPLPTEGATQTATGFTLGKLSMQTGTGSCAASGGHRSSTGIVFPTPFATLIAFVPVLTSYSTTAYNATGVLSYSGASGTGVTVNYDVNIDDNGAGWNMSSPANFTWIAFGLLP